MGKDRQLHTAIEATDETRYRHIIEESRFSWLALWRAANKEDPEKLLAKSLIKTFGTARRIFRLLTMRNSYTRETYVFDTFHKWASSICRLVDLSVLVRNQEAVPSDRTCLFVANHLSPLDIPVLIKAIPIRAAFVANDVLSRIPVFSFWMQKSGTVFIDQEHQETSSRALREMVERLKQGRNLILFPEGYIHQDEGVAQFKRGGIVAARIAGVPIVPVCLYGTQYAFQPGSLAMRKQSKILVEFGNPIETKSLLQQESKQLPQKLEYYFRETRLRLEQEFGTTG